MPTIYVTLCDGDMVEGRGPMVPVAYFTTEELAWDFADRHSGVMGRKPKSGTWRDESYGDWKVKPIELLDALPEDPKVVANRVSEYLKGLDLSPTELAELKRQLS